MPNSFGLPAESKFSVNTLGSEYFSLLAISPPNVRENTSFFALVNVFAITKASAGPVKAGSDKSFKIALSSSFNILCSLRPLSSFANSLTLSPTKERILIASPTVITCNGISGSYIIWSADSLAVFSCSLIKRLRSLTDISLGNPPTCSLISLGGNIPLSISSTKLANSLSVIPRISFVFMPASSKTR